MKKEMYFVANNHKLSSYKVDTFYFGVVFAENHIFELGDYILKNNRLEFVVIVDFFSEHVHLIGHGVVDLEHLAEKFQGGGNQKKSYFSTLSLEYDDIIGKAIGSKIADIVANNIKSKMIRIL